MLLARAWRGWKQTFRNMLNHCPPTLQAAYWATEIDTMTGNLFIFTARLTAEITQAITTLASNTTNQQELGKKNLTLLSPLHWAPFSGRGSTLISKHLLDLFLNLPQLLTNYRRRFYCSDCNRTGTARQISAMLDFTGDVGINPVSR